MKSRISITEYMKKLGYVWSEETNLYYHEKHRFPPIHYSQAWHLYNVMQEILEERGCRNGN